MSAILFFTIVLTLFATQEDYFVTISKNLSNPDKLELTLRNGSFQQAFTQDLLGRSKMEILYPHGELGYYRVNLFFELSTDKVSKGMPKVLYLRTESVPNEAGNVTRVITLTEDKNKATPFTARVIGSTSNNGKVSLYILSAGDNTTYIGALHPGLTDENIPLIREVTKEESPHRLYQGIVAQLMDC
jgi:hypothetical protein